MAETKTTFVKILNANMKHVDFVYQEGLNIDKLPFNPSGTCKSGGLYYTNLENMAKFIEYGTQIADVIVPADAQVYADPKGDKWKADKIILQNIRPLKDHPIWNDKTFCLAAIKQHSYALQHVREQTPEICLAAVQKNGRALHYVREQTPEICS